MLEGAKEYFGKFFEVKGGNRMNPLKKEEMPEYIRSVVEGAREALKQEGREPRGYGEIPSSVNSIETFFEAAKQRVTEGWNRSVRPELDKRLVQWANMLRDKNSASEDEPVISEDVLAVFDDPEVFESKLAISQFSVLESIRKVTPDIWRELVLLASDRQLAEVVVAKHWLKKMRPAEQQELVSRMGLQSPKELEIMLDMAGFMGKYIDNAYVKQIELADAEGGSMESPLHGKSEGVKYLYDVPTSHEDGGESIESHDFSDVFPFEFEQLGRTLELVSKKIDAFRVVGSLPEVYEKLAIYLRAVRDAYLSKETDPDAVYAQYQSLIAMSRDLALADCPIVLLPQAAPAVAGDANKVDIEMRLGFRTRETRELEDTINQFRELADAYLSSAAADLERSYAVPPVLVNHQPFAFGPNTFWRTRGEEGKEQIVAHTNAVIDVARVKARPAFEKVFAPSERISEEVFISATLLDNSLHELGHILVPADDRRVRERTGTNMIAEELKADSGDMKLVHMALEAGYPPLDARAQFVAKLGDVCDYLQNKSPDPDTSGERYFYDGVAIMYRLFKVGIVEDHEDGYHITDHRRGIAEIAQLSDEVLAMYRSGTPDKLKQFAENIKKQRNDPRIDTLIRKLKS